MMHYPISSDFNTEHISSTKIWDLRNEWHIGPEQANLPC